MNEKLPIRVIVVEDERLPRLSLLQKLEDFRDQVEVVDSCADYDSALHSILRLRPDLLMLDIQLPGHNSIELLDELGRQLQGALPDIIFTTAYSDRKYLMNAIKLQAVDYLIKPIDKKELAMALARVVTRAEQKSNSLHRIPTQHRMTFRTASGKLFVTPDKIAYLRADGNYSTLHTFAADEQILESLASLERRLSDGMFVRIDRSTIINIERVYKLNVQRRICQLASEDGTTLLELELSKTAMDTLKAVVEGEASSSSCRF